MYGVAAVFGIIMSGSRTVFVLTAVAVIWVFAAKSSGKKVIISVFAAGAVVAVILAVAAGSAGILERFTNISFGASAFLGRILYVQDALPLILKHPFGLGYYGYYFIQQSVQTGVYTVVNAHNELIQILLDAGVIPAVFMGAAVLRSVFTKRTQSRNRIVLSIMILHSLFDYDFQFLAMGFVLILFLDMRNIKTQKVPVLTGTVVGLTGRRQRRFRLCAGFRTFAIRREIIKRLKKFTVEIQWRSWLFLRKRIRQRK
ncbi:O-antigen ligase family protein [[Ruminococcus] torques]|nr:O-antigen ligase family protein [[Ruminococcus] torques]